MYDVGDLDLPLTMFSAIKLNRVTGCYMNLVRCIIQEACNRSTRFQS